MAVSIIVRLALLVILALLVPVHAALAGEICWSSGAGQFVKDIAFCVSAEAPASGSNSYGPKGLADSDPLTAWCAPAQRSGPLPTIEIRIDDGSEFRRLLIQNGYGKSPKIYRQNSRPKTVEISTDGGPVSRMTLPDFHEMAAIELPSVAKHHLVRMNIIDVYPGEKYADVCLDYLMPDFEYEEALRSSMPPGPGASPGPEPEAASPAKTGPKPPVPTKPAAPKDPFGDLGMPPDRDLELEPR